MTGGFEPSEPKAILNAAVDGLGLICLLSDNTEQLIEGGTLSDTVRTVARPFPGYHLFCHSLRQALSAFCVLTEALRCCP